MSAICGAISLQGKEIEKKISTRFKEKYSKFKIDKYSDITEGNAFMACGLQCFYDNAKNERLPKKNENAKILYTADCILDNREELAMELGLEHGIADGDIILAGYKAWGKDCVSHFQGLFAFVIYDYSRNELFATVDQFAQRCLFYHVRDGVVYFSTLFFPLVESIGGVFEPNERWLIDCVSMRSPAMITEPKETSLTDVLKVVCGTYVVFSLDKDNKTILKQEVRYYDPYHTIQTDWSITVEQSEQIVREEMEKAVRTILQGQKDVAAQLSSGLDSSTVDCFAARILSERGGKVYSYTAVPTPDAHLEKNRFTIYDETEGVKKICAAYSNIVPTFVDCRDRFYLTEAEDIIEAWEMPCKSQQNAVWGDEISRRISKSGIKIMLSGSSGNCTLSAGSYESIAYYYFTHGKILKAYHMFDDLRKAGCSGKLLFKGMFKSWLNYYKWYFSRKMRDCYSDNVTSKALAEKYNLSKRFRKTIMHNYPFKTMDRMRREMYMEDANAQICELETASSLKYGVLHRDPMKTVPFIEMCFKMPIYCFAQKDFDRRLVRAGMKGIVPDEIRTDIFHRGKQSADNTYRVITAWPEIAEKWNKVVHSKEVLHYLDEEKLDDYTNEIHNNIGKKDLSDPFLIAELYSFGIYLQRILQYC